jgi:DNA-directed RNA polymerase specialized sigma24 family protein
MLRLKESDRRRGNALAALARGGDRRARDVLYLLLAPQMEGLMRWQWRRSKGELYALDDLRQEGFVAFCQLLDRWGEGDFFRTFFGLMRWLLRHRAELWGRPGPLFGQDAEQVPDGASLEVSASEAVRCLTGEERQVAEAHLLAGLTVPAAARRLGLSRRTAYRRWHAARERMKRWYLGLL